MNQSDNKKKKNDNTLGRLFIAAAAGILLIAAIVNLIRIGNFELKENDAKETSASDMTVVTQSPMPTDNGADDNSISVREKTESVYTYLQGPKSWSKKREWSGYWGKKHIDGSSFGAYGCGLCCLANIYSSLTPYRCTPVQMYKYTKKVTGYGGGGAIAWGYMRRTLDKVGFTTEIKRKPRSYEIFRKQIKSSMCSLVLVSSYDSDCYWKDTPGHYVTIFLYDSETDKVFLADSGVPEHNRQWVSLKKIYRSLKTSSDWQYIDVKSFDKGRCNWKNKKLTGRWIRPDYIK